MVEDLPDHSALFDHRNNAHRSAAAGAQQDVIEPQ
jgi:hypothetical protein